MIKSLFAVIIGGSVGCTLRWRTFYDNHTLILFGN